MDPISAAATLAPVVISALHRKKKGPNRNKILAAYRNSKPVGYTTPEDAAAAERTRTRIAASGQASAQRARQINARQVAARGLSGAAAGALENDASGIDAAATEEAARSSADQLYKAFNSNLGYARRQNDTAFGTEMGLAAQEAAQGQAQDATFWNSLIETVPAVASLWAPKAAVGPAGTATAAAPAARAVTSTYNPAVAPVTPAQRRVRGNTAAVYR